MLSGDLDPSGWGINTHFLKVEIDPSGGNSFTHMGTTQLLAVPYAFHAQTVEEDEVEDADADPENELQELQLSGTVLGLSGSTKTVNLPSSGGGDNWGSQIVVSDATLNGQGTNSNPLGVENSEISPDWSHIQNIPDGFSDNVDDTQDNDSDATNELQSLSIDGNNLSLSDGGGTVALPSSGSTSLWQQSGSDIFFNSGNVGIGVENPMNILELNGGSVSYNRFYNNSTGTNMSDGLLVGIDELNRTWITSYENGPLYIKTNNKNGIALDGNGNVGIGTTIPSQDLEIYKASENSELLIKSATNGAYLTLDMEGSYASNYSFINFKKGGDQKFTAGLAYDEFRIFNKNAKGLLIKSDGDLTIPSGGRLGIGVSDPVGSFCVNSGSGSTYGRYFNNISGQGGNDGLLIGISGETGWLYNYENGALQLGTNNEIVMSLNANRKVGIGTTGPQSILHLKQLGTGFNSGLRLERPDNTNWWSIQINSYNDLVFDYNGTNTRAWIEHATAEYHYVSDRRLKTDILPVKTALSKVLLLNPVTFRFKSDKNTEYPTYGLIAQEVKEVYPEFVSENNGNLGIAYHNISIVNVRAIQEQQEQIELLTKQIEALLKKNNELAGELSRIKTDMNSRLEKLEGIAGITAQKTE